MNEIIETEKVEKTAVEAGRPAHSFPRRSRAKLPERAAKPSGIPRPSRMEDDEDDETFFQRNCGWIIVAVVALVIGGWVFLRKPSGPSAPVRKAPEAQIVRIQMPPPPPPPPQPKIQPPPPKDEKTPEQAPMEKPAEKPAEPKPVDKPPEGLGTNIKGPGAGMAGLGSSGNGMIGGTGKGPGGGGSVNAWYAGKVQTRVAEAMRNNRKTRSASIAGVKLRVWPDASGRISRAQLDGSTGDAAVDAALQNEVLSGLQMQEPPPAGMPLPIVLRLTARRPN